VAVAPAAAALHDTVTAVVRTVLKVLAVLMVPELKVPAVLEVRY
jgi:hypothetical protein